jgi:hypothetical protein
MTSGCVLGLPVRGTAADAVDPASRLAPEYRAELLRYATDTWRSFKRLTLDSGLPADSLSLEQDGWGHPSMQTSPTNIAAYLWSVLAAERLKIIGPEELRERLEKTLETLSRMERPNGFFLNDIDPRNGEPLKISPWDSTPRRPLLSTVDNAWLAAALMMISHEQPALRQQADKLLKPMDFRFFYDAYDVKDPVNHPGQLRVGYWVDRREFYGHYGMLNSEARIASYVGIALGQLPPDHYYRLYRTFPRDLGDQEQEPEGEVREYMGIKVFEGTYTYRGKRFVPTWGGSMFEALMPTLLVPEEAWAPRSWGRNHPIYVQAQIEHGLDEARYGFWGFSPANSPRGGYETYGVKAMGTDPTGYRSFDLTSVSVAGHVSRLSHSTHGVVTPHAVFLAIRYAPRAAMANLRKLTVRFPIYSPMGFRDSVDVAAGLVSGNVLAVNQGMIMAAITNALTDDALQRAFVAGPVESVVRPIIALEEFSTSALPPQVNAHRKPSLLLELQLATMPALASRRFDAP